MRNLKQDKLYKTVFNEIRKYIVSNKLGPGDKLPTEFEMCAMMGVSRNVLRESLTALQMMGIIKSVPGNGIIIQEFNLDYIFENIFYYLIPDEEAFSSDIRKIRSVLELSFFEEAFNSITEEDIDELGEVLKSIEEKVGKGERFYEEDMNFHMILFRNVNNKTLGSLLKVSWQISKEFSNIKYYFHFRDTKSTLENHQAIYQAIKNKDLEEAKKQLAIHFMPAEN